MNANLRASDGTTVDVELIAYDGPLQKQSIGQKSQPSPPVSWVEIIADRKTFEVYEDRIELDGEVFADVPGGTKHVRIEVYKNGILATADGGTSLKDTRPTPQS